MALKKDKQKVLGEFFDDARIKTFLIHDFSESENSDFALLERAYRGMITENFATFVGFFNEAGHNINGTNQYGDTFLSVVKNHRQGEEYVRILEAANAQ